MSVRTRADELLDEAAEDLQHAIDKMVDVVFKECWGFSDYPEDYRHAIDSALDNMRFAKRKLKR